MFSNSTSFLTFLLPLIILVSCSGLRTRPNIEGAKPKNTKTQHGKVATNYSVASNENSPSYSEIQSTFPNDNLQRPNKSLPKNEADPIELNQIVKTQKEIDHSYPVPNTQLGVDSSSTDEEPKKPTHWSSIAASVLASLGFLSLFTFSLLGLLASLFSILAIIFGAVGWSKSGKNKKFKNNGLAIAGLFLGLFSLLLVNFLVILLILFFLSWSSQ